MINQITPSQETRPRGNRTPDAEVELRILCVASMIVEGRSRSDILLQCATDYGVSRSTSDRYIEEAHEHLRAAYKPQIRRSAEIAKQRLETIYFKAMERGDLRTALAAQNQLSRMQGLWNDYLMKRHRFEISDDPELDERPLLVMRR